MKKATAGLIAAFILLAGCDDAPENSGDAPVAKYPFTPPPLSENPPMSADQIDQINSEVMGEPKDE